MNLITASIAAAAAAIIGAIGWAALSYFANIELGWLAWGIGALVGFAARWGAKEDRGFSYGAMAAAFAILAIFIGKYAAVALAVERNVAAIVAEDIWANREVTPEDGIAAIAGDVAEEWTAAGRNMNWPAGMNAEEAFAREDYPAEVWTEASQRWENLPEEEKTKELEAQTAMREALLENIKNGDFGNPGGKQAIIFNALKDAFGFLDLVFVGLAIYTAFTIGKGQESSTTTAPG